MLCLANFYAIFVISQTSQNSRMIPNTFDLQNDIKVKDGNYFSSETLLIFYPRGLGVWCLTPLSTIF
jgi:hypothetical protein